jgi:phospholipid/cholesterol/gamma-HCH transport system substrate-binding protein
MAKETPNFIKLGIFVTLGLVLLVVALYFIGSNKNLFGNTFKLYAVFADINGLKEGNNVRYAGIDVGTVEKVIIKGDTSIAVEMWLEERMKSVIRKNSIATIGTDGLMGDKLVNIHAGSAGSKTIEEGDEIASLGSVDTEEMLRTLEFTNQNIAVVSENLKSLTENINKSRGTLYTVLMDTAVSVHVKNALDNIESASNYLNNFAQDMSGVSTDLKQGDGLLSTLLNDTALTADFRITMSQIKASGDQVSAATRNMQNVFEKANNGQGSLNTLLSDSTSAFHLREAIQNIDSSAIKLNENLEALKHSFLLRGYFRKQSKKNK